MSKTSLRFVQMSTYTSPVITEVRGTEWVGYGEDNNYYQHLIDRYNGSATNNACINGISQMIYGRGLDAINPTAEEYAQFRMLIDDECIQKVASDLKLLGNAAIQVIYNIDHSKIVEIEHFPAETLRSGKANDDGIIEYYYYFPDWSKFKKSDKPTAIAAFGTSNSGSEILFIKPYKAGFYYYAPPDYQGGLQYAELEEEISNYHLNNILNGLAPSMLINFNNGIPDEDMQAQIEQDVQRKYGGTSNAGRFILAFNDKPEERATIDAVQLSDAHNQYQFLSTESTTKIMLAHRVVSPMLLGIKDQTGLGNNADELKTASILMDNVVIRPFQDLIIEGLNKILAFNQVSLNLYFKTLQPLEFTDLENAVTEEQVIEETGISNISAPVADVTNEDIVKKEASYNGAQIASSLDIMQAVKDGVLTTDQAITFLIQMLQFEPEVAKALFRGNAAQEITMSKAKKKSCNHISCSSDKEVAEKLISLGEEPSEKWILVDEFDVDYDNDDLENEMLTKKMEFVKTGTARPNSVSSQDDIINGARFITRYKYAGETTDKSREFCSKMIGANKIYRKEDILQMNDQIVNETRIKKDGNIGGLGPNGSPFVDVWLYKGGAACHHRWNKQVYVSFEGVNIDVNSPNAQRIAGLKAEQYGYVVKNESLVSQRPIDMPNKAFLN